MKRCAGCLILLLMVGLAAAPAFGAELRVTGFFDNVFPRWDSNDSWADHDATRNEDQIFFGRTRFRGFFNFIASYDLCGVFGIEVDQTYGAPSDDRLGSGCIEGDGPYASADCGFDNGIDNNAIEVKHLYVDFQVPQLPIGNRSDVNGFRYLGVDSSHFYGSWFELLGKSDLDTTGNRTFCRMGETAHLERFGWVIIGGKVEYKYSNELVLTGAAGGFWTAEKTGRPAVFRLGSTPVPAQELARRKIVRGSRPSISPATAASSVGRSI